MGFSGNKSFSKGMGESSWESSDSIMLSEDYSIGAGLLRGDLRLGFSFGSTCSKMLGIIPVLFVFHPIPSETLMS